MIYFAEVRQHVQLTVLLFTVLIRHIKSYTPIMLSRLDRSSLEHHVIVSVLKYAVNHQVWFCEECLQEPISLLNKASWKQGIPSSAPTGILAFGKMTAASSGKKL